ncbi:mechanosensitive ion channel domain-containing protein [Histidinibacterium aquaticum]|uniref:Mechanosensitive ion channel n=1 Tax=Histidinibacterium aquaticum TaxID=2613962 RepID=A0A5J5GT88_9RHOB|nr:mechanosensitive ion channel [Histidinibacterium aquaticum]
MAQDGGDPASQPTDGTPARALIDILSDDAARQALIEELERVAGEGALVAEDIVTEEEISLGRRLALLTQGAAERIAGEAAGLWRSLGAAPSVFDGLAGDQVGVLLGAAQELLVAIVVTIAAYLVLRRLAIPLYRRMGERAETAGFARRLLIFLGSGLIDILVVLVAWALGYAAITSLVGEFGQIDILQSLYLNAFLAVELIKVVVRLILSPSTGHLRFLPLSDGASRYLSRRLGIIVSVLGYGFLLVVPVLNQSAGFAAGGSASALITVAVILYAAGIVLRNRQPVTDWMMRELTYAPAPVDNESEEATAPDADTAETYDDPAAGTATERPVTGPEPATARGNVAALAQNWHWQALVFLAVLLIVALTRPIEVVLDVLAGSGKIALVLLLGIFLSGMLARSVARGIAVPPDLGQKLPLLEGRLNQFVPKTLSVLRLVILAVAAVIVLDILGGIDLRGWMASEIGARATGTVIGVLLTLLVAFGIWLAMTSWIDYRLNPEVGTVATAREATLLTLLKNAATIAIVVLALMFVLSQIGLDIGPLLASAGVLGLAIGFGAQKMVQDIITGIFIQFENAINVGDVVTVGGVTGAVEKLTVRSVSVRDVQGVFHIVPFSSVDLVSNYMRDFSYHVADMGIAYREDYEEAKAAMFEAFDLLREDPEQSPNVLGDLEWFGLNSFGDSAVVLRARIKTVPGTQWGVGRAYNMVLKKIFDERGIEIPFPHQTIYFGEAKDGTSTKLRIAETRDDRPEPVSTDTGAARDGEIDPGTTDAPQEDD